MTNMMNTSSEEEEVDFEEDEGVPLVAGLCGEDPRASEGRCRRRSPRGRVHSPLLRRQHAVLSQLGASKLKKYTENYLEFYLKAKKHPKLMNAIIKAEEFLKLNGQNVQLYQSTRANYKPNKRGRFSVTKSSEEKINFPEEKEKSVKVKKQSKSQMQEENASIQEESVQIEEESPMKQLSRLRSNRPISPEVKTTKKVASSRRGKRGRRGRPKKDKQQIFEESPSEVVQVEPVQEQQPEKQERSQEPMLSEQSNQEQNWQQPSFRKTRSTPNQINFQARGIRKRGRPKKILPAPSNFDEDSESSSSKLEVVKRKTITKKEAHWHEPPKSIGESDSAKRQLLQKIKFCLENRAELIDFLSTTHIDVKNVIDILDLKVSEFLQAGEMTPKVWEILELLKTTMLYKYFPENVEHKRKYERLTRKRVSHTDDFRPKRYTPEQLEIRKKTLVKLEKFLRGYEGMNGRAKERAVFIEGKFHESDKTIGQGYKSLAFEIMKTLKERSKSLEEVMRILSAQP